MPREILSLKPNLKKEELKAALISFKERFHIVLPGSAKRAKKEAVIIVEDALFAVYHNLFPQLLELDMQILLGVAPRYILDETQEPTISRLNVPYALSMQDGIFEKQAPFCTWKELYEMVRSGRVEVASYSFSKMNLTFNFVNLEKEITLSKKMLEEKLPQAISSFIYPFRKTNKRVHKLVSEHYQYIF